MFDILIIADGDIAPGDRLKPLKYQSIIATDGAALKLANKHINIDTIIGDLDSIGSINEVSSPQATGHGQTIPLHKLSSPDLLSHQKFAKSQIIHIKDEDTTDLEKALIFSKTINAKQVLLNGILGKAADHSLHNLQLVTKYHKDFNIWIYHCFEGNSQWGHILKPQNCFHAPLGSKISFTALNECLVTTKGLKWDLSNNRLSPQGPFSVRNENKTLNFSVQCNGTCLIWIIADNFPVQPH